MNTDYLLDQAETTLAYAIQYARAGIMDEARKWLDCSNDCLRNASITVNKETK